MVGFDQDIWRHSRKVTSLFDWAGNSNLVGSVGLDNQMLLYDVRLGRPVLNKFVNAPFQNCLKTYDHKLALAPRNSDCVIEVFDMRKFDQAYASLVDKCFEHDSCSHIIEAMRLKFDHQEAPFNLKFAEKSSRGPGWPLRKRESKFMKLVVGLTSRRRGAPKRPTSRSRRTFCL